MQTGGLGDPDCPIARLLDCRAGELQLHIRVTIAVDSNRTQFARAIALERESPDFMITTLGVETMPRNYARAFARLSLPVRIAMLATIPAAGVIIWLWPDLAGAGLFAVILYVLHRGIDRSFGGDDDAK